VDRGRSLEVAAATVERFVAVLGRDKPLLVFPEGTRSPDRSVKAFKKGGFYAALRAAAPVVPVAIYGSGNIMGKGALDTGADLDAARAPAARQRRVVVRIGQPIYAAGEGDEESRVVDLRDRTRAAVIALYGDLAAGEPESAGPPVALESTMS